MISYKDYTIKKLQSLIEDIKDDKQKQILILYSDAGEWKGATYLPGMSWPDIIKVIGQYLSSMAPFIGPRAD